MITASWYAGKSHSVMLTITMCMVTTLPALSQSCPTSSVSPSTTGTSWNDSNTKNVYIDPTLSTSMQNKIRQAVIDFGTQTGQSIALLPANSSDPGSSSPDSIRFVNDASASPNSFARTQGTNIYTNGVDTNKQNSSTTSFNVNYNLAPATNGNPAIPSYDFSQQNSEQYIYDVTLHELGHAYGLKDAPVPTDPSTSHPNYALQNAGTTIMNGAINTNDQGPHGPAGQLVAGGVGATSVCPNDRAQINAVNPLPPPTGVGPGKGEGGGDGGGGDGGGTCYYYSYEDWDDSTESSTYYVYTNC